MDLLEGIYTRRSIRQFTKKEVAREHLLEIVKAGTWAPSGLNNQPWRFAVLRDREYLRKLSGLTRYSKIIEAASACIAVFIDREVMYHDVKDYQAMGACLQNMLLAAHALGLGAVWLGEILKSAAEVRSLLNLPERYELMAVVAVGHPARRGHTSQRKDLSEVILREA